MTTRSALDSNSGTAGHSNCLLWTIVGLATAAAVGILLAFALKGFVDGRQQQEALQRQQIAIYLQSAGDHRAEGQPELAVEAYLQVLTLDPNNTEAQNGIRELLVLPGQPVAAPTPAVTPATTPTPLNPLETIWADAQALYNAGRWQDAIERLQQVQATQSDFQADAVEEMLYTAYVSLGTEKSNAGSLEEAVNLFDKALLLRPDVVEIRTVRDVTAQYVDALTYWYADWPRVISLLTDLYRRNPGYRDVQQRLQRAHLEYADGLARQSDWCGAAEHYRQAIGVQNAPGLTEKQVEFRILCEREKAGVTAVPGQTPPAVETDTVVGVSPAGSLGTGRILYSSRDAVDGRYRIYAQPVTASVRPVVLAEDGMQPSLRPDGKRLAFRSTRGDALGLGSEDPGTGLRLRFTIYAEDSLPSWNPEGNRLVFASNREGDRRWRIYVTWADGNTVGEGIVFGQDASWHPSADRIVFKGCDDRGNRCGLWTMDSSGRERRPLTTVPGDSHPVWSPDGRYVVFMSRERDGNWEIYRVDVNTGGIIRLTNHPANDGLPTVSPDGSRLAFLSDRDGAWKIWTKPMTGGPAQILASIQGELPDWLEHNIQWVE